MTNAPDNLIGKSIEWTGVHHSEHDDFTELSTHVVTYETADRCSVTAGGQPAGTARYIYKRLDERMAIVIYHPKTYQGRSDVVLYAMLDFAEGTDRAVILADGKPFAIADGKMLEVPTPLG
ncbi:MAG: hypothetical protein R3D01_02885 [Hyphomicrobiales bacterium]